MVSSLPPLLKMSYTLSTTFVMTRRSTVGTETVWAPATPANRRRIPPTANTPLATAPSLRTRRRSMGSLPVAVSLQLYGLLRAPRRDDLPTAGRAAARLGRITCLSASRPRKARTKDTRQSARRPIPPPSDPPRAFARTARSVRTPPCRGSTDFGSRPCLDPVENHLPPIPVDHGRLSITPSLHRPRGPAFPRRPPRPLRPRRPATSLLSAPARRLPRPGRSSFGPTVR